jgi:hypothetical protein
MPIFAIAANDCVDRSDVTVAISPIRRATIRLALRGTKVKVKRRGARVLPGDPKTLSIPQNCGAVETGWRGKPRVCGRVAVGDDTLAWLNRNRRLAKDFESSIASAKAWVHIAWQQLKAGGVSGAFDDLDGPLAEFGERLTQVGAVLRGSADSRFATAAPADPAPTTM